jgi:hypothetical protein
VGLKLRGSRNPKHREQWLRGSGFLSRNNKGQKWNNRNRRVKEQERNEGERRKQVKEQVNKAG